MAKSKGSKAVSDPQRPVACSADFCAPDQQLILTNEDSFVVVKSLGKVSIYCLKTKRFVSELFESQNVATIWKASDSEDTAIFGLVLSGETKIIQKIQVPDGKLINSVKLADFVKVPEHLHRTRIQHDQDGQAQRLVFVSRVGKSEFQVTLEAVNKKKHILLGAVDSDPSGEPLLDLNESVVAKVCKSVKGKAKDGEKITVYNIEDGTILWTHKVDKDRPVTKIACSAVGFNGYSIAVGDKAGRVRVFRDKHVFSVGHWHSLPIESISFTPDGVHVLTGGGEGVIVKWEAKTMNRIALVPRVGCSIVNVNVGFTKIIVATENNSLKVFTSNMEDDCHLVGLARRPRPERVQWHDGTGCVVSIRDNQQLQFFNPLERMQKFSLDVIGENVVLGERDVKVPTSRLINFDVSTCGGWIATAEQNWDSGCVLRLWSFSGNKFVLNTRINEPHQDTISSLKFIAMPREGLGLLTCDGNAEKQAKLWALNDEMKPTWRLQRNFQHKSLKPACGEASSDGSCLILAFEDILCAYDLNTFDLIAALSSTKIKGSYTSVAFCPTPNAAMLMATTPNEVVVWNTISKTLVLKMSLAKAKILRTASKMLLQSPQGIVSLDRSLKPSYIGKRQDVNKALAFAVNAKSDIAYLFHKVADHDSHHFLTVDRMNKDVVLPSKTPVNLKAIAEADNLKDVASLTVKVEEDIYYAKTGPKITGDQLTKKLSNCSESLIKSVLPP